MNYFEERLKELKSSPYQNELNLRPRIEELELALTHLSGKGKVFVAVDVKELEDIFESHKNKIAFKYGLGKTLVMGHREKYWNEAAINAMKELKKAL